MDSEDQKPIPERTPEEPAWPVLLLILIVCLATWWLR